MKMLVVFFFLSLVFYDVCGTLCGPLAAQSTEGGSLLREAAVGGVAKLIPAGSVSSWNCAKGDVPSMTFAP